MAAPTQADARRQRPTPRGWRRVAFPLAAILLALVPFVVLEFVLLALGVAGPERLFVLDGAGRQYVTNVNLARWFEPQAFPREKSPREFRVFCVGASTVQGRPYSTPTAFSTWLQIALSDADPARRYRVVNVGGVSYASHRLRPIVTELLDYEPDLIVLYMGHNEFLEDRTRAGLGKRGLADSARRAFSGLRTYRLLQGGLQGVFGRPPPQAGEVQEILNRTAGLDYYQRDAAWQRDVTESFRRNLRVMVAATQSAGIPLILINPVSNDSDCRPFKSQHRDGLTKDQQDRVQELLGEARGAVTSNPAGAADLLEQAIALDPLYAELFYWKGKALESLGRIDEALVAYRAAKDLDVCPLRMLEPMRETVAAVAAETGTPLLDARALFEDAAGTPLFGRLFLDHVHPTIEGHQLLADALADEVVRVGLVSPRAGWNATSRAARYQEHLASLPSEYFLDGRLGLAQVLAWAHRYDEAQVQLEAVLDEHPRAAPAWIQLGQIHARQQRRDEAVAAWDKAVALEPERAADLLSVALFETESESYGAAQLALETFLKRDAPSHLEIEANYALAVVHFLQDDRAAARRAFARIPLDADELRAATRSAPALSWWSRYGNLLPQLRDL